MVKYSNEIVKLNPSYFAFISGVAISLATNLLTGLKVNFKQGHLDISILVSTFLFSISGILLIFLSWKLEEPHAKWKSISRDIGWTESQITEIAIEKKGNSLWGLMIVALLFLISGLAILFL
jgi:formate/nitrite transporter FocA (FNT family)